MSHSLDMLPPLVEDWPFPLFLIEPEGEKILWANQAAQEWLEKSIRNRGPAARRWEGSL